MKHIKTILAAVALLVISCTKTLEPDYPAEQPAAEDITVVCTGGNPYSLENMRAALEALCGSGSGLEANMLYVRFLPKDSTDLDLLEELELFDHPLTDECDALRSGGTVAELGWQYAAVPVDYSFPAGLECEVLDECYLPDSTPGTRAAGSVSAEDLERAAIARATGTPATKAMAPLSPRGSVMIESPSGNVPVKGIKVRCNYFLRTAVTYTDEQGNFSFGTSFLNKPSVSIVFSNKKDFTIWDGLLVVGGASRSCGKYTGGSMNVSLKPDTAPWSWAVINNAAYDYICACEKGGLPLPPSRLKIMVFSGGNDAASCAPMLRRLPSVKLDTNSGLLNIIGSVVTVPVSAVALFLMKAALPDLIFCPGWMCSKGSYRQLYYHAWHEMAHTSHYSVAGNKYWVDFASHIMTHFDYGKKSDVNADVIDLGESWANAYENYAYYVANSSRYFAIYGFSCGAEFNIKPLSDLMEDGIITPAQMLNCMTNEVRSVPQLCGALQSAYPASAGKIRDVIGNYKI